MRTVFAALIVVAAGVLQPSVRAQSSQAPALASDARVAWLERNALVVRTVDPKDTNFADLERLKRIVGDARIVMLGEISHGDGTTMLAKSRLVRYLHERMGFDVLAFETPLYDMWKAWSQIREGRDVTSALQGALVPVWSRSPQVAELLAYATREASSKHPLALTGFDMQPGVRSREGLLLRELDAFAGQLDIESPLTTPGSSTRTLAEQVLAGRFGANLLPAPDESSRAAFAERLARFARQLTAASTSRTRASVGYWRQIVLNLKSYAEMVWFEREHADDREWTAFNMRDKQNGENLLWLANEAFRGRKVVVWGATVHLMRNASSIDATIDPGNARRSYATAVPAGDVVWRRLGRAMFSIGFTSYEGVNGIGAPGDPQGFRSQVREDQDPSIELEELLNAARFDYALVDFRHRAPGDRWLRQPIVSRPLANQGMRAAWPDVLDAMFFIRRMEPNLATQPPR
jgi:erythromycin esterase